MKDIAIIMLTVFLVFSVIVNVYYYIETHVAYHSNDDLAAHKRMSADWVSNLEKSTMPSIGALFG